MPRPSLARNLRSASRPVLRSTRSLPSTSFRSLSTSFPTSSTSPSSASSTQPRPPSSFTTINNSEISHFSRLSSQWWDENGEFGLLHRMNPTRIEYIRQKVAFASSSKSSASSDGAPEWTFATRHSDASREASRGTGAWLTGLRCLDVGCGGGLLSESLARLGGSVVGVDASESNIGIATTHASQDPILRKKMDEGRLEFRHSPAERLRDQGEMFDVVCAMEVLEHVDEPGEFLKCLGEMVKPGGHLIISTISRTPLSQLLTLTLAEDVLRLVTPGTHTYRKFVKPSELRRYVHSSMGGFDTWYKNEDGSDVRHDEVGETRGIVYDPIKGEGCNYMFHARKRV
ncbi:3-demethylubiquinone-9 3-O-methyltransferase [Kwoniella newhampshirensis]|uniref:Ubiquinone biosynthesis O-methyltransferase, mitochondrial n=1 Tax=Kwoniella newhampshirensis TaxID=1651941 RepID=A0AAW0YU35_9TREE